MVCARVRIIGRPMFAEEGAIQLAVEATPSSRSRLAQQAVQERIKELMLERRLAPGDPMPTEAELVEHLGIGRNSVREALKALQALRIVEVRHGFGTYVGDCSLEPFADALVFRVRRSLHADAHEMHEIVDVRQALEVGLIPEIVRIIDDAGIARLARCLDRMAEAAENGADFAAEDRVFHEQLYAPLGNQVMSQLLRVFWDVYHYFNRDLAGPGADPAAIVATHREIHYAVVARDAARARTAMDDHFRGIRERIATAGSGHPGSVLPGG